MRFKLNINVVLALALVTISGFRSGPTDLDGGTILSSNITLAAVGIPVIISATPASGCEGTITYQWQQSIDNVNFIDIHNATGASYQSMPIIMNTQFRRKAICDGSDSVYTRNIATVTLPQ